MNCLSLLPFYKQPRVLASQTDNTPSHRTYPKHSLKSGTISTTAPANDSKHEPKQLKQKQKQLSVAEIEKVIGAGVFRDRDTSNRNSEENKTLFDAILSNSIGRSEGKVERKLRETGEWLIDGTEKASNSAGKNILLAVFLWILPLWILSFLVASGIIMLPLSTPFLDDLIM